MEHVRTVVAFLLLLAACGAPTAGEDPPRAEHGRAAAAAAPATTPSTHATTTTISANPSVPTAAPAVSEPAPPEPVAVALKANGEVPVYPIPEVEEPHRILPPTTILGTPTVVQVVHQRSDGWTRVVLPGRPNGAEGWIRPEGMDQITADRKVLVDLSERRLTVELGSGEIIFEAEVAIGSDRSPTPTGSYFITDSVEILDGSGPWGPYAFGLSARSEHVTEFNGGDGIIGIHGTNQPGSIGSAASLGCIRLDNDTMTELWPLASVGVPVEIRA